jgi:hypothetical protein
VERDALVYAQVRRINSSNIARYLVTNTHTLKAGWISERIRGGNEEIMTSRVSSDQLESEVKTPELLPGEEGQAELEKLWVKDAEEALRLWASQVCDKDPSAEQFVRRSGHTCTSFEEFMELATYIHDGAQWSVEGDMQLSELLHVCANHQGVDPQNVSTTALIEVLETLQVIRTR